MGLIITGASTMSMRVATMVYTNIITLRPRMSNGLQRNVEDEWQKTTGSASAATAPAVDPNIIIFDSLRNALCTNSCISEEDLAKVVNESVN